MGDLLAYLVGCCNLCDFSARRRNPQQPGHRMWPKENHAVAVPGAACRAQRLAERSYRPARDLDLSELAAGKETDEAAVGRPEGESRALRAGERLGFG